ncbi:hypothetical protein O181_062734 [Austropuccinia psidii MF-1]|uniref:Uncharacterized protein n=1 Tax=Austropuccinia psidii MF-1 TaxID=1389203 RepID=A0A9Q3EKP8_9BASI|nr:hypothetical protein [Austropuccinia psidii MF-1]
MNTKFYEIIRQSNDNRPNMGKACTKKTRTNLHHPAKATAKEKIANSLKARQESHFTYQGVQKRNTTRSGILKFKLIETKQLYYQAQAAFCTKVEDLKITHLRILIAEKGPEHSFQEFNSTKVRNTHNREPFWRMDGELTTEVEQMVTILHWGKYYVNWRKLNSHCTANAYIPTPPSRCDSNTSPPSLPSPLLMLPWSPQDIPSTPPSTLLMPPPSHLILSATYHDYACVVPSQQSSNVPLTLS